MTDVADEVLGLEFPRTIREALELECLEPNVFRAGPASAADRRRIYGGHVVAQALRAATLTAPEGRTVHSLHGYFLRPGDATKPIVLHVSRDRDGGMYSSRRVVACQRGVVVLNLLASFQEAHDGAEFQASTMPATEPPRELPTFELDPRMLDIEARIPTDPTQFHRWPTRLWVRLKETLPDDPNVQACALAFMSDMCTGLSKAPSVEKVGLLPSLDHALWFHRPAQVNDWVLMDLVPVSTSAGRGLYTGNIYDAAGTHLASLAQESLFRIRPAAERLPG